MSNEMDSSRRHGEDLSVDCDDTGFLNLRGSSSMNVDNVTRGSLK